MHILHKSLLKTRSNINSSSFSLLFLFLINFYLIPYTTQFYCSSTCTYIIQPSSYITGCTGINSNECTACDAQIYYNTPTAGTCILYTNTIYNTSYPLAQTGWRSFPTVAALPLTSVQGVTNWIQLAGPSTFVYVVNFTQPHYGIRCRMLLHRSVSFTYVPTLTFTINNTYTTFIQIVPYADTQYYPLQQWIYTTPFIAFRDQVARIIIARTDGVNIFGQQAAFNDVYCLAAYCTPNCLSCKSTADCQACAAGTLYDETSKLCVAACDLGKYANTGKCSLCDYRCQQCFNTSTTCSKCTSSGPYQSFLSIAGTACIVSCPTPTITNYTTHTCDCPAAGYGVYLSGGACLNCPVNCKTCSGAGPTCTQCYYGFYLSVGTNLCAATCPAGQYINLNYHLDICVVCDTTKCTTCVNSSTTCTSCTTFISPMKYLSPPTSNLAYQCISLCPDGYQGNNQTFTCDLCPLGMYSFENVCYSQCPQYYQAREDIRACVLSGGYPLNVSVEVQSANMLKFIIPLDLGLDAASLALLNAGMNTFVTMSFITNSSNSAIINKNKYTLSSRRMLQSSISSLTPQSMTLQITNSQITSNQLILYTNSITASMLIYNHYFLIRFSDNIKSADSRIIYSIRAQTSTDMNPWFVSQYFDLNLKPHFLIGIFLGIFGLLIILMRTKYVYRVAIQYIHCLQLLGLTYYCIYPHALSINLYSFTMGLDFSNFSFIYNVPAKFISPCKQCTSFASYAFVIGDMNWLRLMGSIIFAVVGMAIIVGIVWIFKCSRKYAGFYLHLCIQLIIVKVIHGWIASLIYSGMNYTYDITNLDYFIYSMHLVSYLMLLPCLYIKLKSHYNQHKYVNISTLFLVLYIILISILSIAPQLICCILVLLACFQILVVYAIKIGDEDRPEETKYVVRKNQKGNQVRVVEYVRENQQEVQKVKVKTVIEQIPLSRKYHNILLRSFKIITMFLISCIIMIDDETIPIALVSTVMSVYLILILIDAYILYEQNSKSTKQGKKVADDTLARNNSLDNNFSLINQNINETKQDMRNQRDTQYQDKNKLNIGNKKDITIYGEDNIDNGDDIDDVVANKFRKNTDIDFMPGNSGKKSKRSRSDLIKNFQ